MSRKVEGSRNWWKAVNKLAKAHDHTACQRADVLHKMTTTIAHTYALVGLEDVSVKGMMSNHHLAQAVSDASFACQSSANCSTKPHKQADACNW